MARRVAATAGFCTCKTDIPAIMAIRWWQQKTPEAFASGVLATLRLLGLDYSACTWSACMPFWPCTATKLTFWPSCSDLKPLP